MATCDLCGEPIDFRDINGTCTKIHKSGRCKGASPVNNYRDFRISPDSCCYSTKCRECGQEVFFIRHNGGSVWIDHPLGPPWYKHSCFIDMNIKPQKECLLKEFKINVEGIDENEALVVVSMIDVSYSKKSTRAIFLNGNNEDAYVLLKGPAEILLGKLCIYNKTKNIIYSLEFSHYTFAVIIVIADGTGPNISDKEVICPECGDMVMHSKVNDHIGTHLYMSRLKRRSY